MSTTSLEAAYEAVDEIPESELRLAEYRSKVQHLDEDEVVLAAYELFPYNVPALQELAWQELHYPAEHEHECIHPDLAQRLAQQLRTVLAAKIADLASAHAVVGSM
jgi:hypothetical protein